MKIIEYTPIGIIRSSFRSPEEAPIQQKTALGANGRIEMRPEYTECLSHLEGFSHIILIYHFHLSEGYSAKVIPFLDDVPRGVFATRASHRPNPIGISIVRLESIEHSTLHISNIDAVDGTPLLDIKPYIPDLARQYGVRIGWLTDKFKRV